MKTVRGTAVAVPKSILKEVPTVQLKCPGCSRMLKIPDTAAGKVVKCPCGKQLRVPQSKKGGAASVPAANAAPTPVARSQPAAGSNPFGIDADAFDELTESDLAPVAVAKIPGASDPAPSSGGLPSSNPYASPAEMAGQGGDSPAGPLASRGQRFVNLVLDQIIVLVMAMGIGLVVGIILVMQNGVPMPAEENVPVGAGNGAGNELISDALANLLGYGIVLLYYIVFEAIFAATPAKWITGTRVVSEKGGRAGFGPIIIRSLARMIPFEPFSFLFGEQKQTGWHDTLSGTRVISVRS